MNPRRGVFATDYIKETVECFVKVVGQCNRPRQLWPEEQQWAGDVLANYFDVTEPHPAILEAKSEFETLLVSPHQSCENGQRIPYSRDLDTPPAVTVEQLMLLARRRRSVRWFLQQPVPRKMIDCAIEVAAQSPSACNRQPFVYRVFDDPSLVQKAAEIPMGTAGYTENIPVFIVIVGRQRNYFDERDRHLIYIDASLATMGLIYALEAQGLSSCCINWPDIEDREIRMSRLLGLDADERPVMCLAVGYPDPSGLVAYSQKKSVDQLRVYNQT
jgi:nitroreductase